MPLARVAPDLRPLLQAYERELAEHGFTDWPGVLRLAASAATDPEFRHQLLGLPTLLLDVPLTTSVRCCPCPGLFARAVQRCSSTVPTNDAVTLARLRSDPRGRNR